jgi:hypothetical protein
MIMIKCRFLNNSTTAMALYPFVLTNPRKHVDKVIINHECIHLRQQLELLIIPFYIIYLTELILKGYRNISFEREAYENDKNPMYLKQRKLYSWIRYYRKK